MAKIDFNSLNNESNQGGNDGEYKVKFFSIADGESAIVRIMIDSTDDFDIHSVHRVKMPGYEYGRNVNCINDTHNPATCPLCAAGAKLEQKLFIRMLHYQVENNVAHAVPVVWERSVFDRTFGAQKMVNYLTDYGPLSDIICKITRNGSGLNTTYTISFALNIMPNTKNVYRDDIYVKQTGLFDEFSPLGVSILNKNFDEITQFIATGKFPERERTASQTGEATNMTVPDNIVGTSAPVPSTPTFNPAATPAASAAAATVPPSNARTYTTTVPTNGANTAAPWDNNGGFNRPRRY